MNFQNQHYLYWLTALAVIALWRLIRKEQQRIIVPYLALWLTNKPDTAQINSILKYIFRLLCFLLIASIILALAMPFTWDRHYRSIIVIDNSATMAVREKDTDRWQQACAIAASYAGKEDLLLVTTPWPDKITLAELANHSPQIGAGNPEKTVRLALNLLRATEELVVITDGAGPRWPKILAEVHCKYPDAVVHIVGSHRENVAVQLRVVSRFVPGKAEIVAMIGNHGQSRQTNRLCWQWRDNGGKATKPQQIYWEALPGKIFQQRIPVTAGTTGGRLHCWLERPDAFRADDSAYCVVPPLKKARILLISKKPRPYLLAALASFPELVDLENSGVVSNDSLSVLSGDHLPLLTGYDLVIVCEARLRNQLPPGNYLFWGTRLTTTSKNPGEQIGPLTCWGTNIRHPVAQHLDLTSLKVYKAWKCSPTVAQENTIAYTKSGPLIWEGCQQNNRYIYVAFALEDSQLRWLSALPIFSHNVVCWALTTSQNRWKIQQFKGNSDIRPAPRNRPVARRSFPDKRFWHYQTMLGILLGLSLLVLPVMWLARRRIG